MRSTGLPVTRLCARFGDKLDELGLPALCSANPDDLVGLAEEAERQIRRLQAVQAGAIAEAQQRDLARTVGATSTGAWLAGRLTMRPAAAHSLVKQVVAIELGGVPGQATRDAFNAGDIDRDQAHAIAYAVDQLPDQLGVETREHGEQFLLDQAAVHQVFECGCCRW